MVKHTDTPPLASDTGWLSTKPGSYILPPVSGIYTLYAWAKDEIGNLSNIYSSNAVDIAAGGNYTAAIMYNGTVNCWGQNNYGQCNVPAGLVGVKAISAGDNHTIIILNDGSVLGFGNDTYCQSSWPQKSVYSNEIELDLDL